MLSVFFIALFLVATVVALLASRHFGKQEIDYSDDILICRVVAGVCGVIALGVLGFSSTTMVGTKNLGVLTTFGKPSGYLNNGIHVKWPWQLVTELSDAIQTDTYDGDHCVNVRIARQATACVNVSIRWQIKGQGVDYLFRNYKSNEHITDNLVLRDLQTAMNESFSTYDPLAIDVQGKSTNTPLSALTGPSLAHTIAAQMQGEIGTWIDVQSVNIPLLRYDDATQGKVNSIVQQIALTRLKVEEGRTAVEQAKINKILAASLIADPNVLVSRCLDTWKESVDKGLPLPAGASCFPGTQQPSVVVGGKQ